MLRRTFTLASAVSLVLFVGTLVLWVRSYRAVEAWYSTPSAAYPLPDPRGQPVLFDRQWRIACDDGILSVTRTERAAAHNVQPGHHTYPALHQRADFAAYRFEWHHPYFKPAAAPGHFICMYGVQMLEFRLPLLETLFSALPVIAAWRALNVRSVMQLGKCRVCGYDLRATPDRCPECGTPTTHSS